MEKQLLNSKNYGSTNENKIREYLNNKHYKDLSLNWRQHLNIIFPDITDNDQIKCFKYFNAKAKPDISIRVNKKIVNISIKTGKIPNMHREPIKTFCDFLVNECKINETMLKTIKFYHYGRSYKLSNNGKPFNKNELMENYKKYFDRFSNYFSYNPILIKKVAYRCLFKGATESNEEADYIYYGNVEKGILFSQKEALDIISRDVSNFKRGIHFGGLLYKSNGRNPTYKEAYSLEIRWPMLAILFYDNNPTKYINENIENEKNSNL